MKTKFFPLFVSLAVALCALLFSCSSDIEMPKPPDDTFQEPGVNGGVSSSSELSNSVSSSGAQGYCVYSQIQFCFQGDSPCPSGGEFMVDCPYSYSSSGGEGESSNSSSAQEYDYCVFEADGGCLSGPTSVCPPNGVLSNTCPYSKPSSSSQSSSSSSSNPPTGSGSSNCPGPTKANTFIDKRDCREYGYHQPVAGEAYWMSENLNYSNNGTIGYCYRAADVLGAEGEDASGCKSPYGRAYSYATAVNNSVCPSGWHIPSADEWWARRASLPPTADLAGNFDITAAPPIWKNKGSMGFYWYSDAKKSTGKIGFTFIGNVFQVRPEYGPTTDLTALATDNDLFYVRCVADNNDDWVPPPVPSGSSSSSSPATAKWISFNLSGYGSADPPGLWTSANGTLASFPTIPSRAGYTFDGWYTESIGGTKVVLNSTVFTENSTVFARWTPIQSSSSSPATGGGSSNSGGSGCNGPYIEGTTETGATHFENFSAGYCLKYVPTGCSNPTGYITIQNYNNLTLSGTIYCSNGDVQTVSCSSTSCSPSTTSCPNSGIAWLYVKSVSVPWEGSDFRITLSCY